ncbi:MAG: hypothetical protein KDA91_05880 [Planctomycetaceae bacterium]|nr:hypothetical protein [Planctomycetaceae bacterium]
MEMSFAYRKKSAVVQGAFGVQIALSPNLRRDRVSFSGRLRDPLRFREAIGALHDIVINDLRYKPKDHSAYEEWKAGERARESAIRSSAYQQTKKELTSQQSDPMPPNLEGQFFQQRNLYWKARQQYSNYLLRHDRELWRLLMPCDPVITVANDSLFFECFSADESSYGCLTVMRDGFDHEQDVAVGTTNVDYTWSLYEHFQTLRSYRETRFEVDPSGFEVQTTDTTGHREEKIDLPNSWLRGFMQLQSAMSLPLRRVPVSREGLYAVLAFLKRHRAARSPRAIRFELEPGRPARIVLEPWEKRIELHGQPYQGARAESIRVWGRDRLRVLARLLPLTDHADVYLTGSGLPSFWAIHMGEMRMVLGLSGWTTNDWTGASALQQLAPPGEITEDSLKSIAQGFVIDPARSFIQLQSSTGMQPAQLAAGLNRLALLGQVIQDLPANLYRWRQVMPVPLTSAQVGQDDSETTAAAALLKAAKITTTRDDVVSGGLRVVVGNIKESWGSPRTIELILDADSRIVRGKCNCSHHFRNGLRKGPCRHLQTLRNHLLKSGPADSLEGWFRMFGR